MFLSSFTPAVMRLDDIPQYTAITKSEDHFLHWDEPVFVCLSAVTPHPHTPDSRPVNQTHVSHFYSKRPQHFQSKVLIKKNNNNNNNI